MPPIMIATERYKKLPAGREFKCSSSSAKALSALGMANYQTANTPELMNREMSHVANVGVRLSGEAGSQSISSFDLVGISVVAENPGFEAGTTIEPDNSAAWEDGALGQSEDHAKVSDLDPLVVNDILLQEAEPAVVSGNTAQVTVQLDESVVVGASEATETNPLFDGGAVTISDKPVDAPTPVVGSVSARMSDAKVQHGSKVTNGNPKKVTPKSKK